MIDRLRLENFKCLQNCTLELGALSVLAGANSAGKSSVLQALLLLRQSYMMGYLTRADEQHRLALNGEYASIGVGSDLACEWGGDTVSIAVGWREVDEQAICDDCGVAFEPGSRFLVNGLCEFAFAYAADSEVLWSTSESPDWLSPLVARQPPFGGQVHYLSSDRISPRASYAMADHQVRDLGNLGIHGEHAVHYLATHADERIPLGAAVAFGDKVPRNLLAQVEAWLGVVSPGVRLEVTEQRSLDAVSLRYSFAGSMLPGGTPHRATNVGYGLTACLPIIVAALATPAGGLLMIENPEVYLHPRGQRRLAELLARAAQGGVQVIVETHSDHILNGIRTAVRRGLVEDPDEVKLHYFRRGEPVVTPVLDRQGRIEPWPEGFFDEWDRALDELLAPGWEE